MCCQRLISQESTPQRMLRCDMRIAWAFWLLIQEGAQGELIMDILRESRVVNDNGVDVDFVFANY